MSTAPAAAVAFAVMVVHQADPLHIGIDDGRARLSQFTQYVEDEGLRRDIDPAERFIEQVYVRSLQDTLKRRRLDDSGKVRLVCESAQLDAVTIKKNPNNARL